MSESVQYITNTQGDRVGVLLNLETYQQLTNLSVDTELLIGLSLDELQALAETSLSPRSQIQLDELLIKNAENQLSNEESGTLDKLLAQVDQLNIIKTRARYTLNQFQEKPKVA
jgi:molybdenum cofactor biosynthesis enzyme MoaA